MYEIPQIEVPLEILLMNAESIEGNLFVTEDLLSAGGNPLLEELLNDSLEMFYLFISRAGAYRLINKNHIVQIKCEQDDTEVKTQTPLPPRNLVIHFTNDRTVFGVVYPTLTEETRHLTSLIRMSSFWCYTQMVKN